MNQMLNKFYQNPKKLLLIDAFGAMVSAFMLGIVLVKLESWFGIPKKTLYVLAIIPCVFAAFDFYVYRYKKTGLSVYLIIIALANLLYSFLSVSLAYHHHLKLTKLGCIYIIIEVAIILYLVYIELVVAYKISGALN